MTASSPPFPPYEPPPKKSKRGIYIAVGAIVLVIIICVAVLSRNGKDDPDPVVPPSPTGTTSAPPAAGTSAAPARSAAPTTKQLPTSFSDGSFEVGVDIAPGTYKTTVPSDSPSCYWERQKGLGGGIDDVIANEMLSPGAAGVVRIAAADKGFKSKGCGTWRKSS